MTYDFITSANSKVTVCTTPEGKEKFLLSCQVTGGANGGIIKFEIGNHFAEYSVLADNTARIPLPRTLSAGKSLSFTADADGMTVCICTYDVEA